MPWCGLLMSLPACWIGPNDSVPHLARLISIGGQYPTLLAQVRLAHLRADPGGAGGLRALRGRPPGFLNDTAAWHGRHHPLSTNLIVRPCDDCLASCLTDKIVGAEPQLATTERRKERCATYAGQAHDKVDCS